MALGWLVGHYLTRAWQHGRQAAYAWLRRRLTPLWQWVARLWIALRARTARQPTHLRPYAAAPTTLTDPTADAPTEPLPVIAAAVSTRKAMPTREDG